MSGPSRNLLKQGSTLSLLTLCSRVLGLLREMTKASLLGTSPLSDAFSVAFMIPNLFRRLFAEGSISVAFIPTFKEYLLRNDAEETREFLRSMCSFLSFFVSLAVGLGMILSPLIIPFFSLEEASETVLLTRIMFPFLAFISLAALFQGILNSLRIFVPSALGPIILNLITILAAYGLKGFCANPARAMGIGILLGGFLEAAVQLPWVYKNGYSYSFNSLKRAWNNPGVRRVLSLIGPTIIGMAAYQLNDVVSTALAGRAGAGVVSSLQYSLRLQELILGVFAVSLGTVLLPDLTEYAKTGNWEDYNRSLINAMNIIALITVPISFISLSQGDNLIRLLFQSRRFNEESARLTLQAFHFHMPGLFFIALNRILAPAFYAQSDSKSPTLAGIIAFTVNMILAALLSSPFKGSGIALALTLASGVNTALLLVFLKRNSHIRVKEALASALLYTAKLALFSLIALIPAMACSRFLSPRISDYGRLIRHGLPFTLSALVFAITGILLLAITKDRQFKSIAALLRKKS